MVTTEDELLRLLADAEAVVSEQGEINLSCGFKTKAELATELRSLRERIARQDWSALGSLVSIFAPTGAWDDAVGSSGMNLANHILQVLERMEKARQTSD